MQHFGMAFWEYTLTGFNDFLDQRLVAFTEPMPASRVCSFCGRVPSSSVLLPCGHVLCEECQGEIIKQAECPFDGRHFTEGELVRLGFELCDLEQLRVLCTVAGMVCTTFSGKVSELRDHLRHCRSGHMKCAKCHQVVARDVAVNHYRQCCDVNTLRHSESHVSVQRAVEEIRGIKEDVESLRQLALCERDGDDNLVNGANGLAERLAKLDRALSEAQGTTGGGALEGDSLRSSRNNRPVPGPFRAASKPGVFIANCEFTGVYAARDSLKQDKKLHKESTEIYTLCGYTFKLTCEFSLSGGEGSEEVNVRFILFLYEGEWDDFVEWPFSKKVSLVIAHPRDEAKDIRLTVKMDEHKVAKKPRPGVWNWGSWTEKTSWNEIELQGYIVKCSLYVNVEFE
ncbi:hypothetical protein HPB49_008877 [Dermacentor silvarum]|uniref:Uncharacterized protein n=1 Tax=Dermacentor silvarum TaxID=543639 RepID=A0ACB8DMZ7_DERSI|nr:hypothetical protein HPB49_008877 [Dermacentor silvarum]